MGHFTVTRVKICSSRRALRLVMNGYMLSMVGQMAREENGGAGCLLRERCSINENLLLHVRIVTIGITTLISIMPNLLLYVAYGQRRGDDALHWMILAIPEGSDCCTY